MLNILIFSLGIIYLKPLNRNLAFGFHKNEHLHEFNRSDMFILLDMFVFFYLVFIFIIISIYTIVTQIKIFFKHPYFKIFLK